VTIAEVNALDRDAFVQTLGFTFENSPWIAASAWERRPFRDPAELLAAMLTVITESPPDRRLALICAHPDLAGRVAREGRLTSASSREQESAGLGRLTPAEIRRFEELNAAYRARFGFPFVLCARENGKEEILAALSARTANDRETEIRTALAEIAEIAGLRIAGVVEEA